MRRDARAAPRAWATFGGQPAEAYSFPSCVVTLAICWAVARSSSVGRASRGSRCAQQHLVIPPGEIGALRAIPGVPNRGRLARHGTANALDLPESMLGGIGFDPRQLVDVLDAA
jgi:hypothetical protein